MKPALYFCAAALVALVAFWAYRVNYEAQAALDRVAALRAEIAREREAIAVLRADWAWANAPERLAALVAAHAGELGLAPMQGAQFAEAALIAPPPPETFWARASLDDFARGLGVVAPPPRPERRR
ncbi:MAG: cell division protein FtsL [Rubrimonas sp.]|uniref:cell division protein FtsL n=1 Tax=Rubrimonas sp. TaxID=2036015 RepID=UPI002FDECDBF